MIMPPKDEQERLKQQVARQALEYVHDGMLLGLGSGSTTSYFVNMLGERIKSGAVRDVVGVPTSEGMADQARALGIPLTSLAEHPVLDLVVDGADEVDGDLNLIKGLGRALLREKIVEAHTDRFLVIVDETKLVPRLGTHVPLPVEVARFEAEIHVPWLRDLGCRVEWDRLEDGSRVVTDNGNYVLHCWFADGIQDPHHLARTLSDRPGILEHGLFLHMATEALVAAPEGVRRLTPEG
jgi:ribose 5-phosphate isomerase A